MTDRTFRLFAYVEHWIDGDTFHGIVDQALNTYKGSIDKTIRCRCALINAPERNKPEEWRAALEHATVLIPVGHWYPCVSYKPDPDGFCRPILDLDLGEQTFFSTVMVNDGFAVPYARNKFEIAVWRDRDPVRADHAERDLRARMERW